MLALPRQAEQICSKYFKALSQESCAFLQHSKRHLACLIEIGEGSQSCLAIGHDNFTPLGLDA